MKMEIKFMSWKHKLFMFIILSIGNVTNSKERPSSQICGTQDCTFASFMVLSNIDNETMPCTDFFQFTCGKFYQRRIPEDEYELSTKSDIVNEQMREIKNGIEAISALDDPKSFKLAQRFYYNCISLDYLNQDQLKRMLNIFERLGGWPVLKNDHTPSVPQWNERRFMWGCIVSNMYKYGIPADYLFKLSIERDPVKTDEYILTIDEPVLEFSREAFNEIFFWPEHIRAYRAYMVDVAVILGADRNKATLDLTRSLEFEYNLSNITLPREKKSIRSRYNRMTLDELRQVTPTVDWVFIINNYLNDEIKVVNTQVVIVKAPKYIEKFPQLIANTPNETVSNYLLWKLVAQSAKFLSGELRSRTFNYQRILTGQIEEKPKWRECVEVISKYFPGIVNELLSRSGVYEKSQKIVNDMIAGMKYSLQDQLVRYKWMYADSKTVAIEKIKLLSYNVGYPVQKGDKQRLLDYYEQMIVYSGNYFESMLQILRKHKEIHIRRSLGEIQFKDDWIERINMPLYDPYYSNEYNAIYVPFGILHRLNVYENRPTYLNYAGIGVEIGRLITQSHDIMGRNFDEHGRLENWCLKDCKEVFVNEANCMIRKYEHFMNDTKGIGTIVQRQLMADILGVNIAFYSFEKSKIFDGDTSKLSALNYSPNQLFWLWYATTHCVNYRAKAYSNLIKGAFDIDPKFRIISPLMNSDYFARDFNCDISDTMYTVNRCNAL